MDVVAEFKKDQGWKPVDKDGNKNPVRVILTSENAMVTWKR
jgi:hypothetical protein